MGNKNLLTVEWPHECALCGQVVKNIRGLGTHIHTIHPETNYIDYLRKYCGLVKEYVHVETIQCTKCDKELPATTEYFTRALDRRIGFDSTCKGCISEYKKQRRKDPATRKKNQQYAKEYDKLRRQDQLIQERNKKKTAIRKERPGWRAHNSKYCRDRRKDPLVHITECLRGAVKTTLKLRRAKKEFSSGDYVNYTKEALLEHLNKGVYTFEDYQTNTKDDIKFHIDHIIPVNYYKDKITLNADGTPTEEGLSWIRKCNHYRNLRVWPTSDNASKRDDIDMDVIKSYDIEDLM